jgi:NitT/TauT family transport system permease protein
MTAPPMQVPVQVPAAGFPEAGDLPPERAPRSYGRRLWSAVWPRLLALTLLLAAWQVVVWSGWRPEYVLPGPLPVLERLLHDLASGDLERATATTLQRALIGYGIAVVIGTVLGLVVGRNRIVRTALGSLFSGLQAMPSVAWFPLAILIFQLSEQAILFVVILGAAPALTNGLIAGIDHIPPQLLRAARSLGARRLRLVWFVVLPAALPGYVAGLKQGWAFAWRSLMAGELLVIVGNKPSLGVRLELSRQFADAQGLLASMIAILVIGVLVDSLLFGSIEHVIRSHRGLLEPTA